MFEAAKWKWKQEKKPAAKIIRLAQQEHGPQRMSIAMSLGPGEGALDCAQ